MTITDIYNDRIMKPYLQLLLLQNYAGLLQCSLGMKHINVIGKVHMLSICRAPGGRQVQHACWVTIITSHANTAYAVHVCAPAEAGVMQAMSANGIVCVFVCIGMKRKSNGNRQLFRCLWI